MKTVILARVSSREQEEGHSIDAQIDRLHKYCERKNLEIIKEFIIVESSTRGDRPEFNKMIDFIKKSSEPLSLVCDKVDRLQRSFREVPILEELRRAGKLVLHFNVEAQILDKNASSSQLMAYQMYVMMAEAYTNAISDNVKRSIERKLKEGSILGWAPIGYLNYTDEQGKKDVIIDPDKGHIIRKLFEEYATGTCSIKELTLKAKKYGLRSKTQAGGFLSKSQVFNMLQNKFYIGIMTSNGKQYPHKYERLITKELFDRCQDVKEGRNLRSSKENISRPFIFRGLVTCKKCGRQYTPELKKGKYVYLRPHPKEGCDCKPITEVEVLAKVQGFFNSIKVPEGLKGEIMKSLQGAHDACRVAIKKELATLNKRKTDLEMKRERIVDLLIEGSITRDVSDKKRVEVEKELFDTAERIKSLDLADDRYIITAEAMVELADYIPSAFESSTIEEKRQYINFFFSNLQVEGKNLVLSIRKPFDKLLNLSKGSCWLCRKDKSSPLSKNLTQ